MNFRDIYNPPVEENLSIIIVCNPPDLKRKSKFSGKNMKPQATENENLL